MEPMTEATEDVKTREERQKIRSGLKTRSILGKRKREENEVEAQDTVNREEGPKFASGSDSLPTTTNNTISERKRKRKGPKGPNPLSVKKPKQRIPSAPLPNKLKDNTDDTISPAKRKRKRKPSSRQGLSDLAVLHG